MIDNELLAAGLVLVGGLVLLAVLWAVGFSALLDEGGYPETLGQMLRELRGQPPRHSLYHAIGAGVTYVVARIVRASLLPAALVTMALWTTVEVAQRYPRRPYKTGERGRFSSWDLWADALGLAIVLLLDLLIFRGLR